MIEVDPVPKDETLIEFLDRRERVLRNRLAAAEGAILALQEELANFDRVRAALAEPPRITVEAGGMSISRPASPSEIATFDRLLAEMTEPAEREEVMAHPRLDRTNGDAPQPTAGTERDNDGATDSSAREQPPQSSPQFAESTGNTGAGAPPLTNPGRTQAPDHDRRCGEVMAAVEQFHKKQGYASFGEIAACISFPRGSLGALLNTLMADGKLDRRPPPLGGGYVLAGMTWDAPEPVVSKPPREPVRAPPAQSAKAPEPKPPTLPVISDDAVRVLGVVRRMQTEGRRGTYLDIAAEAKVPKSAIFTLMSVLERKGGLSVAEVRGVLPDAKARTAPTLGRPPAPPKPSAPAAKPQDDDDAAVAAHIAKKGVTKPDETETPNVDDVMNEIRREGPHVVPTGDGYKHFLVTGKDHDRKELLTYANRCRLMRGLQAWSYDKVTWDRPEPIEPSGFGGWKSAKSKGAST